MTKQSDRRGGEATFTLRELATLSGGELIGDPAQKITGAASLAEATDGEI